MKYLYLVRHAKSSWADVAQADFDRPLNERGQRDAPVMAARLQQRGVQPDLLVTSTARRALKTCKLFAAAWQVQESVIVQQPQLYLAAPPVFARVVQQLPQTCNHVLVFAHNPGITEFANQLTNVRIDDMPTCAVFALAFHTNSWQEWQKADTEFLFFDYPKLQQ